MRVERTHVNHTPAQLFDLVADVERFPEFLPWVMAAHVRRRDAHTLWTDMTMGTRFIRRQFSTVAHLDRPYHQLRAQRRFLGYAQQAVIGDDRWRRRRLARLMRAGGEQQRQHDGDR